jgi:uncharacterized protein YdcH (DUF465 family)
MEPRVSFLKHGGRLGRPQHPSGRPRAYADLYAFTLRIRTAMEVPMQDPVRLSDDLLMQNEEYRRLSEQHHEYESRLTALVDKPVLSDDEQVEEVTLKKKKLHLKDRMEGIARQIRGGASH